jgi:glucose/arabinose dehydrogenase
VLDNLPVSYEDFVTGWQHANGKRWGRPADVQVSLKDGAILIADDAGNSVWRMVKK